MNEPAADLRFRIDAAKAMLPFKHQKLGEGGKKDQKQDAAKKVGAGKFAATAPPKLVAAGGRKV
jgi:phage terminase small subunit